MFCEYTKILLQIFGIFIVTGIMIVGAILGLWMLIKLIGEILMGK